ncbi:A/G-specific adenine glycosylase [Limnofasciculus baicalensis]|uniref:Adenine DNA glycosylase n=1 Tax=Limnofasciculus baicalensis BBK-W-15 TaxID=2699891 RepID=A0AAE3GYK1_9CYAN|nr:A/G-specific adenine glycosylase [Limnofasciculus baicalensis]MCP2730972.1 A/G-specific adenine glycosylase [Limnofasciculus baicalensis BBK-W-15]
MTLTLPPSEKNITNHLKPIKIEWFHHQLTTWALQEFRDFPWRNTTNPYAIFIAEFLLQKTGASTAAPIYETFISRYPTLTTLAAASVEEIATLLQPLGLHFRAKRLCQSAELIVKNYNGKIPATETELLALPGIGKYTARSICANAFSIPLAILDTNVARILERFFGISGGRVKSRCKLLWQGAEEVAPHTDVSRWNLTLLDFGAIICTAKNPRCTECPLRFQCSYSISINAKVILCDE